MGITSIELVDFRCYPAVTIEFGEGVTVVEGANGHGKTSILEAIVFASWGRSFRGAPDAALVRNGAERAIAHVRGMFDGLGVAIDFEIPASGRNTFVLNGKRVRRAALPSALPVTVFGPDDLELLKGSPSTRREFLDDLLVTLAPRYQAARQDFERVLRQRNAALRQRADEITLDVLDEQFVHAGAEVARGRERLAERITPLIAQAYQAVANAPSSIRAAFHSEWMADGSPMEGQLRDAVAAARMRDLDRGVTTAGPHRDDWRVELDGMDARMHASQGELRALSLALRLAGHDVLKELTGRDPVILLDDVFSELDDARAKALVQSLPQGQTLLTTASEPPEGMDIDHRIRVIDGTVIT